MAKKSNRFTNTFKSKQEEEVYDIINDYIFPLAQVYNDYSYSNFTKTTDNRLKADIFVYTYGISVEFDGIHHFQPIIYNNDEEAAQKNFEEGKKRDNVKDKLCRDNDIKMVRINYLEWEELKTTENKINYLKERLLG